MSYFEHDDAIRSMIRRGRNLKVDDSGDQQVVDLMGLFGDKPKKVLHVLPHGYSANPPKNSDGLLLALGGRSDRLAYLDGGHKDHRPKNLPIGGTALYDADGKVLKIVKDGIDLDAGGKPVTIRNATTIKIEGTADVAFGIGGCWVRISGGKVYLGVAAADATTSNAVVTVAGPSSKVFAVA